MGSVKRYGEILCSLLKRPNGFHVKLILTMIWILQITTFDIWKVVHGTVAESDDFQKVKRDLYKLQYKELDFL